MPFMELQNKKTEHELNNRYSSNKTHQNITQEAMYAKNAFTVSSTYKIKIFRGEKRNLSTNGARESIGGELSSVDAILIKMTNVELNRSMILSCY
jgi:hypothetical protein